MHTFPDKVKTWWRLTVGQCPIDDCRRMLPDAEHGSIRCPCGFIISEDRYDELVDQLMIEQQ